MSRFEEDRKKIEGLVWAASGPTSEKKERVFLGAWSFYGSSYIHFDADLGRLIVAIWHCLVQ